MPPPVFWSKFAWVDYESGALKVFLSEDSVKPASPILSEPLDLASILGPQAYFGFTGATGAGTDNHDIEAWDLTLIAIPEPCALALAATGLLGLAYFGRRQRIRS